MAITASYHIDTFDLTFTCGANAGDGIVIHPNNAQLDDPAYIEALRLGLSLYPIIYAYEWLSEMSMNSVAVDISRLNTGEITKRIDAWNLIEQHPELEFDFKVRKRILVHVIDCMSEYERRTGPRVPKHPISAEKQKWGYVYLIQSHTSAYKIGRTKNPHDRIKTFGVQLPFEVEYICLIETTDMIGLEKELHERYAHRRVNGEWFRLAPHEVSEIKALGQQS